MHEFQAQLEENKERNYRHGCEKQRTTKKGGLIIINI